MFRSGTGWQGLWITWTSEELKISKSKMPTRKNASQKAKNNCNFDIWSNNSRYIYAQCCFCFAAHINILSWHNMTNGDVNFWPGGVMWLTWYCLWSQSGAPWRRRRGMKSWWKVFFLIFWASWNNLGSNQESIIGIFRTNSVKWEREKEEGGLIPVSFSSSSICGGDVLQCIRAHLKGRFSAVCQLVCRSHADWVLNWKSFHLGNFLPSGYGGGPFNSSGLFALEPKLCGLVKTGPCFFLEKSF